MNKYLAILVSFSTILFSCNGGEKPAEEEGMVFRFNRNSGISSLDPAFAKDQSNIWAVNMLFNGLVQLDKDLEVQPSLAKSWKVSEDGLIYTFNLRSDVYFTDSELFENGKRKLVAADVAYSFNRIIDPKTASPGSWIFNGKVDTVAPFIAIDDTTFQLKLLQPYRPVLSILSMQYTYIVPKEVVEHYGKEFREHPIGTGPFKLKVWKDNQVMILTKNEDYWETDESGQQLPYLDRVDISFIGSKQTEYLNFISGEIDFLSGVDATYIDELLTKMGDLKPGLEDKMKLYKMPYLNTEYLGILVSDSAMAQQNNPLRHKQVRQAINYGFNRVEMIEFLRNNIGRPADAGFVPYGLPSFSPSKVKGYRYDPDKARQLLAEAGYPGGEGMPKIILHTNETYKDLGTYIQRQLQEVGIAVRMEIVQSAFQRELMAKGQSKFFRGSWIADYADAENYLSLFYGEYGAPPNYTQFSNSYYDSLFQVSLNEQDDASRYRLYQQMDSIIVDEAVVVPLYYDQVLRFVQNDVEGLEPNALNLLDLRKVKVN